MLTYEQLDEMSHMQTDQIEKSELADIKEIKIDTTLPKQIRVEKYIEQIKNPYCFRCGKTSIKIEFKSDGAPLEKMLTTFLTKKKK